jgi:hypothetical protein
VTRKRARTNLRGADAEVLQIVALQPASRPEFAAFSIPEIH